MANIVRFSATESVGTALSTELNSLASATLSAAGGLIDNSLASGAGRSMLMDFELLVTYGTNPVAGGYVAIYMSASLDATNFSDVQRDLTPQLLCTFALRATTAAQRLYAQRVPIPPFQFKCYADNQAGQAMGASGNTLRYSRYSPEVQ
jgi:hypothetical protein